MHCIGKKRLVRAVRGGGGGRSRPRTPLRHSCGKGERHTLTDTRSSGWKGRVVGHGWGGGEAKKKKEYKRRENSEEKSERDRPWAIRK